MTASEFASLLRARRVGKGKWVAICPAHRDKRPSLSIAEGRKTAVVFKCMSQGCSQEDIIGAMGFTWQNILGDRIADRATLEAIYKEKRLRAAAEERDRELRNRALDMASLWNAVIDGLVALLARQPDDNRIAFLVSYAMSRQRLYERILDTLDYPWLSGMGVPRFWIGRRSGFPVRKITVRDVGREIADRLGIR